jgi:glycosyltransferase involved in cell wall biosynthesis
MHIALFFTYEISAKDWLVSGLLSREIEIYKQILNKTDIKFTFVTYGSDEDIEILSEFKKINVIPVGKYIKSRNKTVKFIQSLFIPFRIKKELKNIDLMKTNQLMGSWIPIILKLLLKKPLIIRTGYDLLDFSVKEKKSMLKILFNYLLTLFSLLFSDKYFVSSTNDLLNLNKRFSLIKNKTIELRPNWVNIPKEMNNIMGRKKERILMVGRLEDQKNYQNVIKNLSGSELVLDIVGEGKLKKDIANFAQVNNVEIHFLGTLDHSVLLEKYGEYKFYILYSKFEGHPKTLLEAMSQGCVPLVLKSQNVMEVVEHKTTGVILESEKESLNKWIKYLNEDNNEFKRISMNARSLVVNTFSLEKSLNVEIQDYTDLINK